MPYCPQCLVEMRDGWPRCVLHGVFFRVRRCLQCATEVLPEERFCIHCGEVLATSPPVEVVPLARAGPVPRLLALVVDLLCLSYMKFAVDSVWLYVQDAAAARGRTALPLAAPLEMLVLGLLYFGIYQASGRQTIGDQILELAVLRPDREPVPLARSLGRALFVTLAVESLLLGVLGLWAAGASAESLPAWFPAGLPGLGVAAALALAGPVAALLIDRWPGCVVYAVTSK